MKGGQLVAIGQLSSSAVWCRAKLQMVTFNWRVEWSGVRWSGAWATWTGALTFDATVNGNERVDSTLSEWPPGVKGDLCRRRRPSLQRRRRLTRSAPWYIVITISIITVIYCCCCCCRRVHSIVLLFIIAALKCYCIGAKRRSFCNSVAIVPFDWLGWTGSTLRSFCLTSLTLMRINSRLPSRVDRMKWNGNEWRLHSKL